MIEFVYGTDEQYEALKNMLEDNRCHLYPNSIFPSCCSIESGRLGFEKEMGAGTYALFIDKGITCSREGAPVLFKDWLATGTVRFLDFNDLKEFLLSLRCLY